MEIRLRPSERPRTLSLLKLEIALSHHVQPSEVAVTHEGSVCTEDEYDRLMQGNEILTVHCASEGHVDHFQGLREAVSRGEFVNSLKTAAEAICEGKQTEVRQLELYDVPSLSLESTVTPLFPYLTRLDILKLNSNVFSTCSLSPLFQSLPPSLTRLSVENLRLDADNLVALNETFKRLNLVHLILRNNGMEGTGLVVLRDGLKRQTGLKYLMIEQNNLKSLGCTQLVALMSHLQALSFLELRENEFSNADLSQLIRGLAILPSLRHICINGNEMSDQTIRTVGRFLGHMDKQLEGYMLATQHGASEKQGKWGRVRNLAILVEKLRRQPHF